MTSRWYILVGAVALGWSVCCQAVPFGRGDFMDPPEFFGRVAQGRYSVDADALKKSLGAVVLIGGRASGVIVSESGLMITAKHALGDLPLNEDCWKIPLFLNHELDENGNRDHGLRRVRCKKVLVNEYGDDFVLLQLDGKSFPFAPMATAVEDITVGMSAIAAGHPHASMFEKGVKKVSVGPVVVYRPTDEELPHFLHLIDTEGGSSGCPIFDAQGKVLGMHFRGVPNYPAGVKARVDGQEVVLKRFNVALPLAYLVKKYAKYFND